MKKTFAKLKLTEIVAFDTAHLIVFKKLGF